MSGCEISKAMEILNVYQDGKTLGTSVKHKETFNIIMTVIMWGTLLL
jgi:hypothetical protein